MAAKKKPAANQKEQKMYALFNPNDPWNIYDQADNLEEIKRLAEDYSKEEELAIAEMIVVCKSYSANRVWE